MKKMPFPREGANLQSLRDDLTGRKKNDLQWRKGRSFSYIYYADNEIIEAAKMAYDTYFCENALNPAAFPSLRNMERDVVQMCLDLFGADEDGAGSMTSGGTESILMAIKASKDYMMAKRPSITRPKVVLPISVHPAFNKGCHYFGVEVKPVPIGDDYRVDPAAIEAAIDDQTIMIVASAPQYPQGVVDPIEAIGQVALKHDVLMHVDACVGGFVLPFLKEQITFDLSTPGVTSMSADIHKYGYAAKGCSVVLYNSRELRKSQFYVYTDWPGGMYGSPSIAGTRPGGAIAMAYTVLRYIGRSGYERLVAKKMAIVQDLHRIISAYPELEIVGEPDICIFSFTSTKIDIYQLGDELYVQGWLLDRQQSPAALHISVSPNHAHHITEFEEALATAMKKVKRLSVAKLATKAQVIGVKGLKKVLSVSAFDKVKKAAIQKSDVDDKRSAALYGMIGELTGEGEVDDLIKDYLDKLMD